MPAADVLQADLTALPFDDRAFDSALCYGVLMHVPNIRTAVRELARVTRSTLVVSEGNMHSLDELVYAIYNRLRGHPLRRTATGVETYTEAPAGPLLIRHTNIPWLIREVEGHAFTLTRREPGQLTELYTYLPPRSARAVHRLNRAWAKHGGAGLAFGNVLTFERR